MTVEKGVYKELYVSVRPQAKNGSTRHDGDGGLDRGLDRGAVWVLFLNANGTVKGHQKISDTAGNFAGVLNDGDAFGMAVASVGDLDGNGVIDLVVGAHADDDQSIQ